MRATNDSIPESFDWRNHGYVTRAKRQGICSSCWAHITAYLLETQNAIANQELLVLSAQQLIDCSSNEEWGNDGCDGGSVGLALRYT